MAGLRLPLGNALRAVCHIAVALLLLTGLAAAAAPARPVLPALAGWQTTAASTVTAPLPTAQAAVMREFGLRTRVEGRYRRGNRQIAVIGSAFTDAGGAFGAYTYLRAPTDRALKLGRGAGPAAAHDRGILLLQGAWLLQLQWAPGTVASPAALRAAATHFAPRPSGAGGNLPGVLFALPAQQVRAGSVKYAEGPLGFAAACDWLPAQAAGFQQDAEAAIASYDFAGGGTAQLVLLSYPTPQIANHYAGVLAQQPGLALRRSGAYLALVHGSDAVAVAHLTRLLESVHFHAQVVMTPFVPPGIGALPALILGILLLCLFLMATALVVGLVSGAAWVWLGDIVPVGWHRLRPRPLTRLNLTDGAAPGSK